MIKLTTGVIRPNKRHNPAANEIEATRDGFKFGHPSRNCTPVWITPLATTVRSSNKPRPGHPVGNVVNSLCTEVKVLEFFVWRIHRRW